MSGAMRDRLQSVPTYVWTFVALVTGISLGGLLPDLLQPVAILTTWLIRAVVALVPLLIFAALSPSIATLVRRGLAGKFAASVIIWYVLSSSGLRLSGCWACAAPKNNKATAAATNIFRALAP